jgi:probable phosphoglycerate mutase
VIGYSTRDPDGETRIVVVRHGETEWSAARRHTGRSDLQLTPEGRRQAARLAHELAGLDVQHVFSSPLSRARQTCEIAGFGERMVLCAELQEWDYGEYEGLTYAEIRARDPGWMLWRDGCPGGESPAQVSARADRALELLTESDPTTVLAFAHGHILRVLAARWIESDVSNGSRFLLATASVGVLGHERKTRAVERWNTNGP